MATLRRIVSIVAKKLPSGGERIVATFEGGATGTLLITTRGRQSIPKACRVEDFKVRKGSPQYAPEAAYCSFSPFRGDREEQGYIKIQRKALPVFPPGSSTRLIKVYCPECGYTMRVTRKWLEAAVPRCPVCFWRREEMEVII